MIKSKTGKCVADITRLKKKLTRPLGPILTFNIQIYEKKF